MDESFDVQHRDVFESLAACAAAGGADLVLTSPPYPDARSDAQYGGASFDTSVEGYHRLGLAVLEALKPGGVCALNIDGPCRVWRPEIGESERSLIAFQVAIDWAHKVGFRYIEHTAYLRDGVPLSGNPRWRSGWEPVHVFSRPGAPPYFDRQGLTLPAVSAGRRNGPGRHRRGGSGRGDWAASSGTRIQGDRRALTTTIAGNPRAADREHPAPFASEFADAYVLCYGPPDGLVCDPFVGSGTVALSCHRHGRRFIGGDLGHREKDGRRWVDIVNEQLDQGRLFA